MRPTATLATVVPTNGILRSTLAFFNHSSACHGITLLPEGVVGLEYKIPVAPIAISLDYRPQIVVSTADGAFAPGFLGFGLGIKFTF